MTNDTRTVVLGGGGPVGVAWELGIAAGLGAAGVDLRTADRVIGTSAGSITGSMLRAGEDPAELIPDIEHLVAGGAATSGADSVSADAMSQTMEMMLAAGGLSGEDALAAHRRGVGKIALEATTIGEDSFVEMMGTVLAGRSWPVGFSCTAVDTASGDFQVWDENSGVPLERAVASSCSVPGVYPPITIDGRRYMDGGVRSGLNADLAAGDDAVVVISCMPLELPPGIDDARVSGLLGAMKAEVDALADAGAAVALIVPDMEFLMISGFGMNLMDFSQVTPAAEAGERLGKAEADRVAGIWGT